jgi:hypothetical protein
MGLLLATSEMDKYYANPYFQLKLSLIALVLVHALYFRPRVYNNTAAIDSAPRIPGVAKAAAVISLVLWIGIASCGRWIAYWEPPRPKAPPISHTAATGIHTPGIAWSPAMLVKQGTVSAEAATNCRPG